MSDDDVARIYAEAAALRAAAAQTHADTTGFIGAQLAVTMAAVRAIIATHPNPDSVRVAFDGLIAQMQAHPAFMGDPKNAATLRSVADTLFRPPLPPETFQ